MKYYYVSKNDELKHWKYIKKVRGKNGKWRYYYDADQLKDAVDESKKIVGNSLANELHIQKKVKYAKDELDSSKNSSKTWQSYLQYDYEKQLSNQKLQSIKSFIARTRYKSLLAAYENTPLSKIMKKLSD